MAEEQKGYYRCEKNKLWFKGRKWKRGEIYFGEEPRCGKGISLSAGKMPTFVFLSYHDPTAPEEEQPQSVDLQPDYNRDDDSGAEDPRTKKQILADIQANYGEELNPRLKKADILEKERLLKMTARRDVGVPQTAETDFDPLK